MKTKILRELPKRRQISTDKWECFDSRGNRLVIIKHHGASYENIPAWYQLKIWDLEQTDREFSTIYSTDPLYKEIEELLNEINLEITETLENNTVIDVEEQISLAEEKDNLADEFVSSEAFDKLVDLVSDQIKKDFEKLRLKPKWYTKLWNFITFKNLRS